MIERFQDESGARRLIEALRQQRFLQGDSEVAAELSRIAVLREFNSGEVIIAEKASDNDLYCILAGKVAVHVNGRHVAVRSAGDHVGEMAMIDPSARRCATVIAIDETVVAHVPEQSFVDFADKHPRLWRLLAVELCNRLRQRNALVRMVNTVPVLFVASSVESLPIAREIQDGLKHDDVVVRIWTDKVFGVSRFPMEDLELAISEADFGLIVVGPDDKIVSREMPHDVPRDNVIFELGMCMGILARCRTFILRPKGIDIKIPTDLLGLTPLDYNPGGGKNLPSFLGPVCNELRRVIADRGSR